MREMYEAKFGDRRTIRSQGNVAHKGNNATNSSAAGLNKTSSHITQPKSQGASQAMLYATGLKPEDMGKAQVGISSVWYEGNPCNMHLMDLSNIIKRGVQRAGLAFLTTRGRKREEAKFF